MNGIDIGKELAEIKLMLTQIKGQIETLTPTKVAFRAQEAAEYIGVSKTTMYGLLNSHELKYSIVGGRMVIKRTELDDYLTWREIEVRGRRKSRH